MSDASTGGGRGTVGCGADWETLCSSPSLWSGALACKLRSSHHSMCHGDLPWHWWPPNTNDEGMTGGVTPSVLNACRHSNPHALDVLE